MAIPRMHGHSFTELQRNWGQKRNCHTNIKPLYVELSLDTTCHASFNPNQGLKFCRHFNKIWILTTVEAKKWHGNEKFWIANLLTWIEVITEADEAKNLQNFFEKWQFFAKKKSVTYLHASFPPIKGWNERFLIQWPGPSLCVFKPHLNVWSKAQT